MTRIIVGAAFIVGCWIIAAAAQDAMPPKTDLPGADAAGRRYQFNKTGDGVLRLDTETGQVSYCTAREAGWVCQLAADDRTALDNEIVRLQTQIDSLKKQMADAGTPAPTPPRPPEGIPPSKNGELKLPSRADLDRAKAFIDEAWRRLVDMVDQWRHDLHRS